jgi:putative hydrolase of HD superfamily
MVVEELSDEPKVIKPDYQQPLRYLYQNRDQNLESSIMNRLIDQIQFIMETDTLKNIFRGISILSENRRENDAEHSWHTTMIAIILSEYSNDQNIDILKILKMLLIHDIVEIDAGDSFCFDPDGAIKKNQMETQAADRIFGLLPKNQNKNLKNLWHEFAEMKSAEARFANAIDRFQPLLLSFYTGGHIWKEYRVTRSQVVERTQEIKKGSTILWRFAELLIDESVRRGYLIDE